MGPIWGPSGADRTQVGPMLAPWTLLSGKLWRQVHYNVVTRASHGISNAWQVDCLSISLLRNMKRPGSLWWESNGHRWIASIKDQHDIMMLHFSTHKHKKVLWNLVWPSNNKYIYFPKKIEMKSTETDRISLNDDVDAVKVKYMRATVLHGICSLYSCSYPCAVASYLGNDHPQIISEFSMNNNWLRTH